ncbi:hypothetical protein FB550_102422 [Neobacillus bataviensis]|uniref:Uncharacterized protein n=1 Tax=Neobacillus bataviensis TaxID=220685 RepID=A0A561DSX1_9BACI|nr:hypothetical protein [Neobacillus bataviensis]TWE06400.1 hypothetical protein FB550_102422 [Neobacillus bataviensis]
MSFIMSLPAEQGINLYVKAVEKDIERQAWEQWLVAYQNMTKENFISFNDYFKQLKQPQRVKDNRSDDEIIQDAESILKSMKRSDS